MEGHRQHVGAGRQDRFDSTIPDRPSHHRPFMLAEHGGGCTALHHLDAHLTPAVFCAAAVDGAAVCSWPRTAGETAGAIAKAAALAADPAAAAAFVGEREQARLRVGQSVSCWAFARSEQC